MARQHLVCRAEIVGLFQSLRVSKLTRLKIIRNTLKNKIRAGFYCQGKVRSLYVMSSLPLNLENNGYTCLSKHGCAPESK